MIQRIAHEISTHQSREDAEDWKVLLEIDVKGSVEDKSDALLMIGEAWMDEMLDSGFDPEKAVRAMMSHKSKH